ncbi:MULTISPECIES: MCE family protein [Actinomadura]|uniref:MCE family protein n=1 Tax=Actinomadura yumaensis TaxID=111807 RepID=A0ABW2CMB6_9ACTN|nr:MCE family protein [Actinomadura sp. J1-007]MWK38752.1 MCE family protein [Actinomadura sp. J1-007]
MSDEHLSQRSRTLHAAFGIAVMVLAAVVVAVASAPPGGRAHRFRATFRTAGQGLDPGRSDVKVRGVTVGRVESARLLPDGRVAVGMRVERGVRVTAGTVAAIEPVSVFGPKDLTLEPGPPGRVLPDGATIARTVDPREATGIAGPAYELSRAVAPEDVETLLRTLGSGLDGQGPALRRTVVNGSAVLDAFHARRAELRALVSDLTGLSGTFAGRGGTVTGIAGDLNRLGPAVHGRPDRLGRLLDETAGLAERVGGTLARKGGAIGETIDGLGRVAEVMGRRQGDIPVLLNVLDQFFSGLGGVVHVPGPEGSILARGIGIMSVDLCEIFVDLCTWR